MSNKKETADQRKIRLARALKANIGRRKAQAKERLSGAAEEGTEQEHPSQQDGCPN